MTITEADQFCFEQPMHFSPVARGDGVRRMRCVGEREIGGQVPASAEVRFAGHGVDVVEYRQQPPARVVALVNDRSTRFETEAVLVAEETATIRWRFRFGSGSDDYVRGVNLMRVSNGKIVEALGYSKTPAGDDSPLTDVVG